MLQKLTQSLWVIGVVVIGAGACSAVCAATSVAKPAASSVAAPSPAQLEFFEKHIRPLLSTQCYKCHSTSASKIKGGLSLDSRDSLLKGGDSGPAIVPGNLDHSLLIKAVRYGDKDLQMPPKHQLAVEDVAVLEQWVKMGAPDPRVGSPVAAAAPFDVKEARKFWSLQPVKDPTPPAVSDPNWQANPIDHFVRAKQAAMHLEPAQLADRRTLIRRVTFDLTGLPPTPREVEAFIADASPNAYEKVVDRLLASNAYGEKWGRHWLDLVRYADTTGCNSDFPVPDAYRYRNWVIDAFNADKPYDEFLKEQLAGDLLPAKTDTERFDHILGTGYLAIARRFGSRNTEFYLTIDDVIDNVGKTTMGLTIGCARCHDHKFDPIAQADYYALYGIFNSTTFAFPGTEIYPHPKDFTPLATGPLAEAYHKHAAELAALDARAEALLTESRPLGQQEREIAKLKAAGKPLPGPKVESALVTQLAAAVGANGVTRLAADVGSAYLVDTARFTKTRTYAEVIAERKETIQAARELAAHGVAVPKAYAVFDKPHGADAPILKKGDPKTLGDVVPRTFLTVLGHQKLPATEKGSGRLELARWIASKDNPLTARVMVNRIWQWHFGKGIVQTPSDFGVRGKAPTHPELLDYLATRFVQDGWSVKRLQKTILMSRAYRLASEDEDDARAERNAAIDAGNDYLAHFNRRRMEAEEVRDSMLAVSGLLETGEDGPHPFPNEGEWNYTQHRPFYADYPTHHRAVYLMQQRLKKQPFLEVFDGADPNAVTSVRAKESSPIQALFFMNDPLAYEAADHFATRVETESTAEDQRVDDAFRLCFARPADSEEKQVAQAYLSDLRAKLKAAGTAPEQLSHAAWSSYLRVLLGSDEFFYID